MFALAIIGPEEELHYWTGGEYWEIDSEAAVSFVEASNAEETIPILRRALPQLLKPVQVVDLEATGQGEG